MSRKPGLLSVLAALLLVSAPFAADQGKPNRPAGDSSVADAPLDAATLETLVCPVSGEAVDAKVAIDYRGGRLYLSSNDALKEFRKHGARYAAPANLQLFSSGQAEQVKCPLTGKETVAGKQTSIAGTDVVFCCDNCLEKAQAATEDERLELAFGSKAFAKGFKVKAKPKTARADRNKKKDGVAQKDDVRPPTLEQAIQIQERNTEKLMLVRGVTGTAVGFDDNDNLVIKVFTEDDARREIPQAIEGVPVQVHVTGPIQAFELLDKSAKPGAGASAQAVTTVRFTRPVPTGVSTGNVGQCSAGTISCRVKKGGSVFALSNNHVFTLENLAPLESLILQPGRYDTGCSTDTNNQIGKLEIYKVITFGGLTNQIDAALASTTTADLGNGTPSDGYGIAKSLPVAATVGLNVQKYGRTTKLTRGRVYAINATVAVGYSSGTATFVNQIIVVPRNSRAAFLQPGDSGSLVVTYPGKNPVGLLFAGNSSGSFGVANRIQDVLSAFSVTVDGQ